MNETRTCPKCRTGMNTVTHHCDCGAVGEYECPECEFSIIYSTGRKLICNFCNSPLRPRFTIPEPRLTAPTYDNPCTCSYREHAGAHSTGRHHATTCPMFADGLPLAELADLFVRSLPIKKRPVNVCRCGHLDESHVRRDGVPGCGVHMGTGEYCPCSGFRLQ